MPEYLAPGVYVEEVDTGPKPIEGVSTSTSGMVGLTERGPENVATLVTSFADFQRQFGGYLNDAVYSGSTWFLPHAVEGFFTNGGKRLYIVRVLPDSATFACNTLFDLRDAPPVPARLAARVVRGDRLLLLDDSAAVLGTDAWVLLEGGQASEYVQFAEAPAGVVSTATPVLAAMWRSDTVVEGLDALANVLGTTRLIADVSQGEFLLPVANAGVLAGSVTLRLGDPANPAAQESHPAADNGAVSLSAPLVFNHNLNAPIREPSISLDHLLRNMTLVTAVGNTTISLDNRRGIIDASAPGAGQQIRITNVTQATDEIARIQRVIGPRSAGPDPGDVLLETALANAYAPGDVVRADLLDPEARTPTLVPPVILTTLGINNRRGLVDSPGVGLGQQLLVSNVTAGTSETMRIQSVVGPRAAGLDPGDVILETPLANAYNPGDVVSVDLLDAEPRNLSIVPPVNNSRIAMDNRQLLTDTSATGAGLRLLVSNVTAGTSETMRIQSVVGPRAGGLDPGDVILETPLANAYNPGDAVRAELLDPVARTLTQDAPRGTIQVRLNNRACILDPPPPGNQVHFLRFTDAAGNVEFARIDTVDAPRVPGADPGPITLESPLQRDYVKGDTVALLRDTNNDTNFTFLAWDADPDDRALVLGDSGAYGAGSFVRIENIGAANSEYSQIPVGPAPVLRIATGPFRASHAAATHLLGRSPVLAVQAIDRGTWGNMLRVLIANETSPLLRETRPVGPAPATNPTLTLRTTVGVEPGTVLEFFTRVGAVETVVFRQKVASINGNVVGFGAAGLAQPVTGTMLVRSAEFQMTVELVRINPRTLQEEAVFNEQLRQLSLDYRHSRYAVRVIGPIFVSDTVTPRRRDGHTEGESNLIRITDVLYPDWPRPNAAAQAQVEAALRRGLDILQFTPPGGQPRPFGLFFTGGNNDIAAISPDTYRGSDGANPPESRTGIFALKNIEEIAIVAVPGRTDQAIQEALINHCELMRYRFAVQDSQPGLSVATVQDQRSLYDTKYGAIYYPWLCIDDPFPDNPRARAKVSIPPSGHVMGIYARSDIERGVHKAPANEVIRGIQDLEFKLMKEEQDILNPRNINVLRNFRENNRGLRVWGARTLSSDPDWKYVNVRRLFIFVEHSIDRGTQWVVFEPNNEALWERVKRVVSAFLTQVWRDGALMGKTKEEAFFVKCDRSTMTQADIDNGRLIIQVGIAPVKPAEFVIFRIGQWVGGSSLEEG
jgi:phage tail sheath protein FI